MSIFQIILLGLIINLILVIIEGVIIFILNLYIFLYKDKVQIGKYILEMEKNRARLLKLNRRVIGLFFIPFSYIILFSLFLYNIIVFGALEGLFRYSNFYIGLLKKEET